MRTRMSTSRLKSAALFGAAAFGLTAFGDNYYEWTAKADAETGKAYWEDTSTSWTWNGEEGAAIDQWRLGYYGLSTVSFKTAATVDKYVAVCNGAYTFTADASTEEGVVNGLTGSAVGSAVDLDVGWWWGGAATLNVASGAYHFDKVNVGGWAGFDGTLNVTGGSLDTPRINIGIGEASSATLSGGDITIEEIYAPNGTFTLSGGTLNAAKATDWMFNGTKFVVNGGTIASDYAVRIVGATTGAGTLTKKGAGTLTIANADGFVGTIAVAENGGTVVVPLTATRARPGAYTTISKTEDAIVFAYDAEAVPATADVVAATIRTVDFEDASTYASGWTATGNGQGMDRQTRPDKESSYLAYYAYENGNIRQTYATYTIPSDTKALVSAAGEYIVEMDWFATVGYNGRDTDDLHCDLKLYSDDKTIIAIDAAAIFNGGQNGVDASVYGYPAGDELATLKTAPRGSDSTDASKSAFWYHVIVSGSANGVYLTVTKQDNTVVVAPTRVSDYYELTSIVGHVASRLGTDQVTGGIDDISFVVPGTVAIGNTGYTSFAAAVAAAKSGDTISLYADTELTASVVLPWGAELDLNGCVLYTTDTAVEVTFDDGAHYITSETAGGTKTFTSTIAVNDTAYVWVGGATKTVTVEGVDTTVDDNAWSTRANWTVGGETPESAPTADSVVYIPATATIECAGQTDYTGTLTFEGDLTLTGAGITLRTVTGDGTFTLQGTTETAFSLWNWGDYTIDADVCMNTAVYNATGASLVINGAFSGDATITHYSNSSGAPSAGFQFYGDVSGFTGEYHACTRDNGDRDETRFFSGTVVDGVVDGSGASWTFGFRGDKSTYPFQVSGATYKFGQLTTRFSRSGASYDRLRFQPATSAVLEVGALEDKTSVVAGSLVDDSNTFKKVGSGEADLYLTESKGAVVVDAGTLNLKAVTYTVEETTYAYVPASATITAVGAKIVADNTIVDSGLEPVLTDALTASYYRLGTTVGASTTTFEVGDVARDSAGTGYKTIAEALAAITAEGSELDPTITLLLDTNEPLVIPVVGFTLAVNGTTYTGTVTGASGVAVTQDENGNYIGAANTSATWTGAAGDNLWTTPGNWSTLSVPTYDTDVTFGEGDYMIGINSGDINFFKNIYFAGNLTLHDPNDKQANWPRIITNQGNIEYTGDTTDGMGTLTLKRCGIYNWKGAEENGDKKVLTLNCNVAFENSTTGKTSGYDSWMNGGANYVIEGNVTGTGLLKLMDGTSFVINGDVTIGEDAFASLYISTATTFNGNVTIGSQGTLYCYNAYPTFGAEAALSGSGEVVLSGDLDATTSFKDAVRQSTWTGTVEIHNNTITNYDLSEYGNSGSTVRANILYGFPKWNTSTGTGGIGGIKALEIASGGLRFNDNAAGDITFTIDAPVTGSGKIEVGTTTTSFTKWTTFVFAGDMTEFTGSLVNTNFLTTAYANPVVVIKGEGDEDVASPAHGAIYVQPKAFVTVGNTWTAPGGLVINGAATVSAAAPFDGPVSGAGALTFTRSATTLPSFNGWTGVSYLAFDALNGGLYPTGYGSNIVLAANTTGHLKNSAGNGNAGYSGTLTIADRVTATINNGWPGNGSNNVKVGTLAGEGDFVLDGSARTTWNDGIYLGFVIDTIDNFAGTITVGDHFNFKPGAIVVDAAPADGVYVKVAIAEPAKAANIGKVTLDGTTLTVGGVAKSVTLMFDAEKGGIVAESAGGLDPNDAASSYESTAETEEAAIAEAAAKVVEPFKGEYFSYKTAGEAGAWTVTIDGFAEGLVEDVLADALAFDAEGKATVTVPAGLYYLITTRATLGGEAVATLQDQSDGTALEIAKPGTEQGFIEVKIGTAPISAETTVVVDDENDPQA